MSVLIEPGTASTVIVPLTAAQLPEWLQRQTQEVRRWVDGSGFRAEPGSALRLTDGTILFGIDDEPTLWSFAAAPAALSPGDYFFVDLPSHVHEQVALGWGLGCYRFDGYK